MAASIKNTLIVPGESIGDFKLGTKLSEATKEMNDEVFYTLYGNGCSAEVFTIRQFTDKVNHNEKKRLAGKIFNGWEYNSKSERVQENLLFNDVLQNMSNISTDLLDLPRAIFYTHNYQGGENFDFFKKNYIIDEVKTSHFAFHTKDGIRVGMPLYEVEKIYGKLTLEEGLGEGSSGIEYTSTNDGLSMEIELDPAMATETLNMNGCGIDYQEGGSPQTGSYQYTTKYSKACIVKSITVKCLSEYGARPSPLCPDGYRDMNETILIGGTYTGELKSLPID